MVPTPLSEVYEKLKEHRRQGEDLAIRPNVADQLKAVYKDVVQAGTLFELEFVADTRATLIDAILVRLVEVVTLAERVFGDDAKAKAWLKRPNPSLSGQKPADLLKDELGTAVVRELLERIDHGIYA